MEPSLRNELLSVARGECPAELVLKHATIVDVCTESLYTGDIAVHKGYIAGVGEYEGVQQEDFTGKYVAPGFIDAHVHIESTMVSPSIFASRVLPHGTTAIVADPHEIVNVCGARGLDYMLENAKGAPVDIFFMLPSCVPLSPLEHNGARYTAEEMKRHRDNPRVLGLGEAMDYISVIDGAPELYEKIDLLRDKVIDGHSPMVGGKPLQAYRLGGVQTDHECSTYGEALERLRAGMYVQVREGSAARNLTDIITGAVKDGISCDRFLFCTDDKHLEDVASKGHIDYNIRRAVACGLSPITAIKIASLNAARVYGLNDRGMVAAGMKADLVVLSDLPSLTIERVYKDGRRVDGAAGTPAPANRGAFPELYRTVHIAPLSENDLRLPLSGSFPVMEMLPGQILTKRVDMPLPEENGCFAPRDGLLKVAVIQRHTASGDVGVGAAKGFGLQNGAIATTIAHDSHNLIVIGDNDADMLLAAQELEACGGGCTVVSGGRVLHTLSLPVAGLFTDDPADDVEAGLREILRISRSLGVKDGFDPVINLSFMALTVIPELRLTDIGLFDVLENKLLSF